MGLYKRGKIYWMSYSGPDGRRVQRSTRVADKAAAQMIYTEARRAVELSRAGVPLPDPVDANRPLALLVDEFCDAKADEGQSRVWVGITRSVLTRAADFARWDRAGDITPEAAERWLRSLDLQAKTFNDYRAVLLGFCRWLMTRRPRVLTMNPIDAVPTRRTVERAARPFLSDEECRALLACAPPRDRRSARSWPTRRATYLLMLETGVRKGEARRLLVGHVRAGALNPFVEIPGEAAKNRRTRRVPLGRAAAVELAAWTEGKAHDAPLLPTMTSKAMLHQDLKRAGVSTRDGLGRELDLHALRKTFACRLARAGVAPKTAQELMGHADIQTTFRIYMEAGVLETREAVGRLPAISGGVAESVADCVHDPAYQVHQKGVG